jgi:hypothetical protein
MSIAACPGDLVREEKEALRISPALQSSVFVIFTSTTGTLKALEKAAEVVTPFDARIMIIAVQVVPFPLPLDRPPVPFEFIIRRFRDMATRFPKKTRVSAYVCRDQIEALKQILPPGSPIVIGIRKTWWPTRDRRLARKLRRAGHEVTLVETE